MYYFITQEQTVNVFLCHHKFSYSTTLLYHIPYMLFQVFHFYNVIIGIIYSLCTTLVISLV